MCDVHHGAFTCQNKGCGVFAVTHVDVGFSFRQAKLNAVGFAFKQREFFVVVSTTVLYRNLHRPIQILPSWVSIRVLQSVKNTNDSYI